MKNKNELKCALCGEKWNLLEGQDPEQIMVTHTVFNHPMELLSHPKIQTGIAKFFEELGGSLARKLKGIDEKQP